MSETNSVVAIYETHTQAEEAVKELQRSGFDMKKMSIVGKDYHTDEHVVGYYNTGDRMMYWGKMGAFWGGLWGMLFGAAFFAIPGIGPILVAGPLVAWIIGALEGAVVVGGLSALGAGLVQHWHPQGQRREIRGGTQVRQVSPSGSWHVGRGGQGQGYHADDAPSGGYSTRGGTRRNSPGEAADSLDSAAKHLGFRE